MYANVYTRPEHRQIIDEIDLTAVQPPGTVELTLLWRSLTGVTAAPHTWDRINQRWPTVDIWVVFALRTEFIAWVLHRNLPLPHVYGLSPCNFFYTDRIRVRDLADIEEFRVVSPAANQDYITILQWLREEYNSRTGGMPWANAYEIFAVRSALRNAIG